MAKDFQAVADYLKQHPYKPKAEPRIGAALAKHYGSVVPDRSHDPQRVIGSYDKPLHEGR